MLTYAALHGPGLGFLPSSMSQYLKPATTAPAPTTSTSSWGSIIKNAVATLPKVAPPPQPSVPTGSPMMPPSIPIITQPPTNGTTSTASPTAVASEPSSGGIIAYQTPWYESTGGKIGLAAGSLVLLGTLGYFAFGR